MTIQALSDILIFALGLPSSCRVDQRVPKKMLVENGAPTTADKRLINDHIEEIQWIAALKPNTVGVAQYHDEGCEYAEVAVLSITMRNVSQGHCTDVPRTVPSASSFNIARLAELVHRAVPYPVLLLLATPKSLYLSVAHKRWAHSEIGKVVLDGEPAILDIAPDLTAEHPFVQAIALARQPQTNLMALYQGWMDCLTALQAARHTGTFTATATPAQAAVRRNALRTLQRLGQESARLRALAVNEKQMAKQVELNIALMRINAEMKSTRELL